MDTINYIELLDECNRKRKNIELQKLEYKTIYGKNIKGVIFRDKFYSVSEYEDMSSH